MKVADSKFVREEQNFEQNKHFVGQPEIYILNNTSALEFSYCLYKAFQQNSCVNNNAKTRITAEDFCS